MKIFTGEQIRRLDELTIRNEPVSSTDLMERAARSLFRWIITRFGRNRTIYVISGPGNNGGDGLALSRMLYENEFRVVVVNIKISEKYSADWIVNRRRLQTETSVPFIDVTGLDSFPDLEENSIVIDAIFGTGLSRPVDGLASDIINTLNQQGLTVISIDIPSGLFDTDNGANRSATVIKATYTLTFQFPKLAFLFPENNVNVGKWEILPIGLDAEAINRTETPYALVETGHIANLLFQRNRFAHKGNFGHALLLAGSKGKMGAAVLGAKSCLRAGAGLVTAHVPSAGYDIIQTAVPEAMTSCDPESDHLSMLPDTGPYDAIAAGPGLGQEKETASLIHELLVKNDKPLVLDADALNIISSRKDWFKFLGNNVILTPHPGEFERLAGKTGDGFSRLNRQSAFSKEHGCIIVLKGAFTSVSLPDGNISFNNTGNPGMATAGSGDVLTGIILSLLAQGYSPANAAIVGTFIHGMAGDIGASRLGYQALIASDITENLGEAFLQLTRSRQ
ncbi:MAG: NAD(P)H-hydrate dehydratase [Bacteroidales bacterium]